MSVKYTMNYSKGSRFFPNECYICKSRENLKRCQCNMISYCGFKHKLQLLPNHRKFCTALMQFLEEEKQLPSTLEWTAQVQDISKKIEKKLERPLNESELAIIFRLRVCFKCYKYKDVELSNCPGCPVVSFCKDHPNDEIHDENCPVMVRYLNLLSIAEELDIDLQFLPSSFPFITNEEKQMRAIDYLTLTLNLNGIGINSLRSRFLKNDLLDFIDVASKLHIAIQKIHNYVPSEIIIHIDALSCYHAIVKQNYWEFLLHFNSDIKALKIVVTGSQYAYELGTSLCETCTSAEKNVSIEIHSNPYEEYTMRKDYQKPDVLFYFKIEDINNSERTKKWTEIDCPIVLLIDSKLNFCKTQYFLSSLTTKFQTIHEGQICTPFSDISSSENDDYLIILKSKAIETLPKARVGDSSSEELFDKLLKELNSSKEANKNLREQLNSSVGEVTKLKKRNLELEDICSRFIKKSKLIKETFADVDQLEKIIS